jgi:hypothetical protein
MNISLTALELVMKSNEVFLALAAAVEAEEGDESTAPGRGTAGVGLEEDAADTTVETTAPAPRAAEVLTRFDLGDSSALAWMGTREDDMFLPSTMVFGNQNRFFDCFLSLVVCQTCDCQTRGTWILFCIWCRLRGYHLGVVNSSGTILAAALCFEVPTTLLYPGTLSGRAWRPVRQL